MLYLKIQLVNRETPRCDYVRSPFTLILFLLACAFRLSINRNCLQPFTMHPSSINLHTTSKALNSGTYCLLNLFKSNKIKICSFGNKHARSQDFPRGDNSL